MDHRTDHFWLSIADMLSQQKLFLNSRTKFNDPYDSEPIIENDLSNSVIRKYIDEAVENPYNSKRTPSQIARIMSVKALGRPHLKKGGIESIKENLRTGANEFLDSCGLLSFSLTGENPLLWGHYAAAFTGVCAVFRRGTSTESALSICARVAYVDQRPRLALSPFQEMTRARMAGEPYDDLASEIFFLSFLHKSNHWSYEKEARIFYPFSAFEKAPFESSELIGFILGPKAPPSLEKRMREEIKMRKPSAALDRSSLSQNEFKVVIPHKFTHQHASAA
jgi:Protein of unknown function (DUF2971)